VILSGGGSNAVAKQCSLLQDDDDIYDTNYPPLKLLTVSRYLTDWTSIRRMPPENDRRTWTKPRDDLVYKLPVQ